MNIAFLQNQWVRNPERVRRMLERHDDPAEQEEHRLLFIRYALFAGCLTGRRIKKAFGEELIDTLLWEEVSRQIGGHASSKFPPDFNHIRTVIEREQPQIVIAFGQIAREALERVYEEDRPPWKLIFSPHPVARQEGTVQELKKAARLYRNHMDTLRSRDDGTIQER